MRPVLYEIRRAITSKSMIALIVFVIAIPVLIAFTSASGSGGSGFTYINSQAFAEGNNGTYNITVFLYNSQYGTPVQGTTVNFTAGTNVTSAISDAEGYANVTFHNVPENVVGNLSDGTMSNMTYEYTQFSGGFGQGYNFTAGVDVYQKKMDPYFTESSYKYIVNGSKIANSIEFYPRMQLNFYSVQNRPSLETVGVSSQLGGTNGTAQFSVYYEQLANYTGSPSPGGTVINSAGSVAYSNLSNRSIQGYNNPYAYFLNESQLTLFGTFTESPVTVLNTINLAKNTNSSRYLFEIFTPNGTEMAWATVQLSNPASQTTVNNVFYTEVLPILGLFVPLMAVLSAYLTFGKDKVSGALNYVVVRPMSRASIISSRYLANNLAIFIPAAASIGISSLLFDYYLGTYIPEYTILLSLWAIAVMTAGFCGIMYLASAFFKSGGILIGLAIGLFLILDLFWTFPALPLIPLVIVSRFAPGSLAFASAYIISNYVSPSGFANLVSMLASGSTNVPPFYFGNFLPSQIGITVLLVVGLGAVWILAPFILAVFRFSKYD